MNLSFLARSLDDEIQSLIDETLNFIRQVLSLVRETLNLTRETLSLIGEVPSFICEVLSLICEVLSLIREVLSLIREVLNLIREPPVAAVCLAPGACRAYLPLFRPLLVVTIPRLPLLAFATFAFAATAVAQFKMQTPAGEAPGPWLFGTIGVGKGPDPKTPQTTALKGLAIKVGENGEAAVAYDLDLCRMVGAWTGGKFTTPMNLMSRGEYPTALGDVAFTTPEIAGFQVVDPVNVEFLSSDDPRPEPFGPLPKVRFKGMYVNGGRTVLKWDVKGTEVLEMPGYEVRNGIPFFVRTFRVGPSRNELLIPIYSNEGAATGFVSGGFANLHGGGRLQGDIQTYDGRAIGVFVSGSGASSQPDIKDGYRLVRLMASESPRTFQVFVWAGEATMAKEVSQATGLNWADRYLGDGDKQPGIAELVKGGSARWPETVTTEWEPAKADPAAPAAAYVVDTLKLPDPNPWNAPMFIGGFDFFEDGRAAFCTFHGDVFVVEGLPAKQAESSLRPSTLDLRPPHSTLDSRPLTWRRVASGLYHALGLKVVKGEIYVTCRDGIYRLKDLNGDGETDFYEVFNNDIKVTKNFHEFVFDLHTDSDGYFYFAKAGPVKNGGRGFDQIMSHHGTLLRVSPSGKSMEVMATGFRAPNGIGIGPNGEMTSGDNEGTWTPMCRLNWIKPGGFYGVVDLAHRKETPTDYDRPLCWFPKKVDNSSGSQVWVPDNDRWGPWRGQLLHLSYGQCLLYGVMKEEIIDANAPSCCQSVMQGGVVQFPVKFESGIMRARFNPIDGQLYVAGLRGWQTSGIKNGCFQRVRYTGAPARMPIGLHAKKDGIQIQFTDSLDTQSAADPDNWSVEAWDYIWSSAYGSPEISTTTPLERGANGEPTPESLKAAKKHRDRLEVKSVQIGTDDRTVFLEIPGLKPVMQMMIKYQIKTADGAEMKGEVVTTIHGVSES